jgi:hypothetical protein
VYRTYLLQIRPTPSGQPKPSGAARRRPKCTSRRICYARERRVHSCRSDIRGVPSLPSLPPPLPHRSPPGYPSPLDPSFPPRPGVCRHSALQHVSRWCHVCTYALGLEADLAMDFALRSWHCREMPQHMHRVNACTAYYYLDVSCAARP